MNIKGLQMKIIMLDYSDGTASIFSIPNYILEVENYLIKYYNYKESEMNWMQLNKLEFNNLGEI